MLLIDISFIVGVVSLIVLGYNLYKWVLPDYAENYGAELKRRIYLSFITLLISIATTVYLYFA